MKITSRFGPWPLLVYLVLTVPAIASELDDIVPGNWVEVRGKLERVRDALQG